MAQPTGRDNWRFDTISVHGGYSPDPTTKAVAVPIYQTVAYAFDNAQHGAIYSISRYRATFTRAS
jgi:O-acetylhomoserine (thiol)-lyase